MFVLQASRYSRSLAPVRDQLQGWLELRRLWCGKFPVAYVSAVPSFLGRGWCLGIGAVGWRLSLRWFPRWSRRWVELLRCKAPMRFGLLWRWWGIFHFGLWGLVTRKILNMPSTDCRCKTILTLMILHEFVMNLCLMYLMFRFFLNVLICPLTWSGDVRRCQFFIVLLWPGELRLSNLLQTIGAGSSTESLDEGIPGSEESLAPLPGSRKQWVAPTCCR